MPHHKTSSKIETLEKLSAEACNGIQKACDRKCETETKHGERLKEAAEKHNVVNAIIASPILRRMAEVYNKKHDTEKKKTNQ